MDNNFGEQSWNALSQSIEVPDSAYENAATRYHDLGKWLLDKSKAKCAQYSPHVFAQGSFRLGTVIKPWKREDFDLDLVCELESGMTTENCTQESLKGLVGADLEQYRIERSIKEKVEEKHRCWRFNYQDTLKFHLDTLPSIPHSENTVRLLQERMIKSGNSAEFAGVLTRLAVAITDDRHAQYRQLTPDWYISNPEGYANWFESRMRQARQLLESRALMEKVANIDDLPTYRWKTPLQRAVQVLKRHRDVMFENNPDAKPISIIITTLAARAYDGSNDVGTTLSNIVMAMGPLVSHSLPKVPNPVNPKEDFAEKWTTSEGRRLGLEDNFNRWLFQAKIDFDLVSTANDKVALSDQALKKFGTSLDERTLTGVFGASATSLSSPKVQQIKEAPKPWRA